MEKETEIYCDKCGCATAGEACQICGATENRIKIVPITPNKLAEYIDFIQNNATF